MGRRVLVAVTGLAVVALVALLGACSPGRSSGDRTASTPTASAPQLSLTPADGTSAARPERGVTVSVVNGKIQQVTVTDARGHAAEGQTSADGTRWATRWALRPATSYTVTATATGRDGRTTSAQARFTTLKPARVLETGAAPLDGETVGIGFPIAVYLSAPITDKAAVERAFEVRMSTPVEGAWHWVTDREVWFRPKTYWPPGEKVTFVAHVTGVRAGPGLYGTQDQTVRFTVGPAHVTTVNTRTHRMTVRDGGRVVRTMPISTGRPGKETSQGVHIVQETAATTIMDSSTYGCGPGCPDYYRVTTQWNVRLTNSGEFVHSAPWSVGDQGSSNVSHGCVNASPENARWFFQFSRRGDVVIVTGSPRPLRWYDGFTPWALSWQDWLKGSATGPVNAAGSPTPTAPTGSASPATATPQPS